MKPTRCSCFINLWGCSPLLHPAARSTWSLSCTSEAWRETASAGWSCRSSRSWRRRSRTTNRSTTTRSFLATCTWPRTRTACPTCPSPASASSCPITRAAQWNRGVHGGCIELSNNLDYVWFLVERTSAGVAKMKLSWSQHLEPQLALWVCVCLFSNTPKIDGFTLYNISKWKSSNLPNLDLVWMQPLSCRWPSAATLTSSTISLTLHFLLVSCTMLFMGNYFVFKWDIYLNMNHLCVFVKFLKCEMS